MNFFIPNSSHKFEQVRQTQTNLTTNLKVYSKFKLKIQPELLISIISPMTKSHTLTCLMYCKSIITRVHYIQTFVHTRIGTQIIVHSITLDNANRLFAGNPCKIFSNFLITKYYLLPIGYNYYCITQHFSSEQNLHV